MSVVKTGEKTDSKPSSLSKVASWTRVMNAFEAKWFPAFIFFFAFFLRYLYNAVFMEHRIAHFGDAYNFLRSGSALLQAATSSGGVLGFFGKIYHPAEPHVQLLQSMTSMNLTDRLLIDGPVFPSYLAAVEWLTGVDPATPIFDAHSVQICLCNSVVDALACVLIYFGARFAFTKRAAMISAFLFASYPAAIINTQHCYSEPFSYFLLCAWTSLVLAVVLRHSKLLRFPVSASWIGIGLLSGLLMLSKPAFVMLPPMVVAVCVLIASVRLFVLKTSGEARKKSLLNLLQSYFKNGLLAALGAIVILTPWVLFNKVASGQYSVFVNRVPSFNIFHGNQIKTDAWRCYPFIGTFPGDSAHVIASLAVDAKADPITFVGLQFKKVARLWAGEWNEYHYSLFGIPLDVQNVYHQILLLLGSMGLAYGLFCARNKTLSRAFTASAILGTIILFHFAYIPFEAISRYAITAMPACVMLAASLLVQVSLRKRLLSLLALLASSGFVFYLLSLSGQLATLVAAFLPPGFILQAPFISVAIDLAGLFLVGFLVHKVFQAIIEDRRSVKSATRFFSALLLGTGLVAAVYTIQSQDWKEWSARVPSGAKVNQTIVLPAEFVPKSRTAFVLLDISSDVLSAPVLVEVNGHKLQEPLVPLAQLQPDNTDIVQCLAIQAEGMSRDVRGFRNWWVVPFDSRLLNAGAANVVSISSLDDSAQIRLYGDYRTNVNPEMADDGLVYLPSLRSFSYTKGFTTFDHRDPRVFEKMHVLGKTQLSKEDMSESPGVQSGAFRLRILLPTASSAVSSSKTAVSPAVAQLMAAPVILQDKPKQVLGKDPSSFMPDVSVVNLPVLPEGIRFDYSCEIRKLSGERPCFVSLSFSGTDEKGLTHSWTSRWQPIGIAKTNAFRTTSFSDTIPSEMVQLRNLKIQPMFSPFQPDFLFLHKKEALRSGIEVRNAHLRFLPALDLPTLEKREFELY